ALLPILLLNTACPLVIDEPEDSLAGEFVCSTVVEALVKMQPLKQFIIVTHEPNIPVLSDALRNFIMDYVRECGVILVWGNVDAVKEHIERVLEGGREAFARRLKKYGH